MDFSKLFQWNSSVVDDELPNIWPMPVSPDDFVRIDVVTLYSKILTDTLERTHGLTDEESALLWDNCVGDSNASQGLVTRLSKAMADKQELFLVYDTGVIRPATREEQEKIKADYSKEGDSETGVFISFKNYIRSDMVKLYTGLEYCAIASLHKSMNLSKAIQFKMADMRASTALIDKAEVKSQAKTISKALGAGRDVMLDAKDIIETSKPDLTATKESVLFIGQKLSLYLGLPASYLTGEQTTGMGTTGESDTKAIERGLKGYYFSIVKPTLEAIFGKKKITYKSQDFRAIAGSMEVVKTFALVDDTLISADNKRKIINGILELPEDAKGDAPPKPVAALPAPIPAKEPAK